MIICNERCRCCEYEPIKSYEDEPIEKKVTICGVRDRLNNLKDLVDVCGAALLHEENSGQPRTQISVAHVLYFFVESEIITAEAELAKL